MQKKFIIIVTFFAIAIMAAVSCSDNKKTGTGIAEVAQPISRDSLVSKGRYLVTIMGRNDCHSPKKMGPQGPEIDSARMLSGHPADLPVPEAPAEAAGKFLLFNQCLTAFIGPWGTSYAANITSDETGIGSWSEAQFLKAIREGKLKGMDNSRPILPPMPWQMFRNATDEDLKAIFAYLKSTPPVNNPVPSPIPPKQLSKL